MQLKYQKIVLGDQLVNLEGEKQDEIFRVMVPSADKRRWLTVFFGTQVLGSSVVKITKFSIAPFTMARESKLKAQVVRALPGFCRHMMRVGYGHPPAGRSSTALLFLPVFNSGLNLEGSVKFELALGSVIWCLNSAHI